MSALISVLSCGAGAVQARAERGPCARRHVFASSPNAVRGVGLSSRATLGTALPTGLRASRPSSRALRVAGPRAQTISETVVDLDTPTGKMRTYVFKPTAPGKYPGVLFFSEIFQVTGPIRRSAQLLACHGFVVAVPEIYHEFEAAGVAFSYEGKAGVERGNELKVTKTCAAYDSDSAAVLAWLAKHPDCTGALGVAGFCIGGHLAFRAAMNAGVRAAACFYATDLHKGALGKGGDNSLQRLGELAAAGTEMMMIWGRQDPHVPLEGRVKIHAALAEAGVNFTWHEFNGQHAFMRDEGPRYDGELALSCYRMTADLFKRKLHSGDLPVPSTPSGAGEASH